MEKQKFETILIFIVPEIIKLIVENYPYDEVMASKKFYESEVYSVLADEETKLWHLSPLTIYNMFDEETKTGKISFPEGA
ncbi:MAG: hypothetical protein IKM61_08515 [Eubacteriaceae bacterium]|nr:hypothetical protein [Eubacteriaceae bacterium]